MALTIAAACSAPGSSTPPLATTDWTRAVDDLDCSSLNRGIEVLGVRFSDLRAPGVPDAYVWVDCFHDTSPWPHQLEVFAGDSDPRHPRRVAVPLPASAGELIRSVDIDAANVVVTSTAYAADDGLCCPSLARRHVFSWSGDRISAG